VYLLQVGQALAMRCRCRAPDFDITGRNIKSDICLLKKFSVCAVYNEKKKNYAALSLYSNYIYIYYVVCNIYIYIYIYTSRVSLCIHAFGMTFIGARETRCGNISRPEADIDLCDLDDLELHTLE